MTGDKRFVLKTIRKRQLQFFWHLIRADGLEKKILSGKICGTKSKGRQRTKYTDSLNNFYAVLCWVYCCCQFLAKY